MMPIGNDNMVWCHLLLSTRIWCNAHPVQWTRTGYSTIWCWGLEHDRVFICLLETEHDTVYSSHILLGGREHNGAICYWEREHGTMCNAMWCGRREHCTHKQSLCSKKVKLRTTMMMKHYLKLCICFPCHELLVQRFSSHKLCFTVLATSLRQSHIRSLPGILMF